VNILVIGLSLAAVLFLLSAGLTLIFGMLGVINFAHGSFYMLGAYLGFQVIETTGNFWVALVVAPLLAALVGAVVERLVLHPVYDREPHYQMLLAFGIILLLEEAVRAIWGLDYKEVGAPAALAAPTHLLGATVSTYRLFIIGFGAAIAALLFAVLDKTRVGMVVRAASSDPEMVRGLGIDVNRVRTGVFAFGTGLAALGGAVTAPLFPVELGMGFSVIIDCFVVIVIGGLGSIKGAVIAALLLGLVRAVAYATASEWVDFGSYSLLILVLLTRPQGLFGRERRLA
jgi:branched-chain amino acid transport system permease protein